MLNISKIWPSQFTSSMPSRFGSETTLKSRSYLFSGLLVCGECKSRLVIISGQGKRGYVRYGCPSHRYRGVCANTVTIRQDRLEEQLLAAIEQRIANPGMIEHILVRFQAELKKRLADLQRQNVGLETLRHERSVLKAKTQRLAEAVAAAGHSPALLSALGDVEHQIAVLDRRIETFKPINVAATLEEIRDFVSRNLLNLRDLLHQDASRAKAALSRHIGQLILKPKQTPSGSIYEVSGGVNLLSQDVMQVVARDGIEPPTPAFSGLHSANDPVPSAVTISSLFNNGQPESDLHTVMDSNPD
jgi:site-specific DNA recombinase